MKKQLNKKGFTLIEVVLVLAIGGLIFLLAFLAFQQVSRNRRDTQRRSDLGRIVAEIQNYASDNNGAAPTLTSLDHLGTASNQGICELPTGAWAGLDPFNQFSAKYLCSNGSFAAPDGRNYTVISGANATAPTRDQIKYTTTLTVLAPQSANFCDNTTAMTAGAFKIEIGLEGGAVACRDSR